MMGREAIIGMMDGPGAPLQCFSLTKDLSIPPLHTAFSSLFVSSLFHNRIFRSCPFVFFSFPYRLPSALTVFLSHYPPTTSALEQPIRPNRLNFREHPIAPRMQHPLRVPVFSHRGTRGFGKLTLYSRGIDRFNAVEIIEGQRVSLNISICFDEDICISVTAETKLHDHSFS